MDVVISLLDRWWACSTAVVALPAVKLIAFEYYALFTSFIALNCEIISPYSYYVKKGLVCIAIVDLSNY